MGVPGGIRSGDVDALPSGTTMTSGRDAGARPMVIGGTVTVVAGETGPPRRRPIVWLLHLLVAIPVAWLLREALDVLLRHHWATGGIGPFLAFVPGVAVAAVQMFLPGAAVLGLLGRRTPIGIAARFGVVLGATSVVWWGVFWAEAASPAWGSRLTWVVMIVSIAAVGVRRSTVGVAVRPVVALLLVGVAAVCVMGGSLYLHGGFDQATNLATNAAYGTPDAYFPLVWLDRVETGASLTKSAFAWPMIDRPPLQSAMQEPAVRDAGSRDVSYELTGQLLEGLVISSLALLLAVMGVRRIRLLAGLALLLFTPHMAFSLVFVWPKMLTAAFMLVVVAMFAERRPRGWVEWATIGTVLGSSVVAHPGGAFALPVLAVVMVPSGAVLAWWRRRRQPASDRAAQTPVDRRNVVRSAAVAAAGAATTLGTWILYRLVGDTTPSALLKWHLGGVTDLSDTRSLTQVLRHDASVLGLSGWLHLKKMNLLYIFGDGVPHSAFWLWMTNIAIFSPVWVCGLVALLVPFAFLPSWRTGSLVSARRMIGAGLLASGLWLLVEYGPPQAPPWTHQGPYAAFLLVGVGAVGAFVLHANRWLIGALVAAQTAFWVQMWWSRGLILNCSGPCRPSLIGLVHSYTEWTIVPGMVAVIACGLGLFWWSTRLLGDAFDAGQPTTSSSTVIGSPSMVADASPTGA